MKLTQDQEAALRDWVEAGYDLGSIQSAIQQHWQARLTFLEVRFLLDDYNLTLHAPSKAQPKAADPLTVQGAPQPSAGGVSVTLSPVAKPGSVMNGTVTFSDGVQAQWQLDEMGRLGLIPSQSGYRPSPQDVEAFQMELGKLMS